MSIRKLLFVFIKAGIFVFYACNDNNTSKTTPDNPLIGKWNIDSVSAGRDSNQLIYQMFSSMKADQTHADFHFKSDSLFIYIDGESDTGLYHFDVNKKQMILIEEPGEIYDYTRLNDSMISLTMNDKTVIYLKRQ